MANRFPLIFNTGTAQIQELAANDNLDLTSSGVINASQVGIETTSPTSKLHVVGDTLVTGVITATTFVGALTGTATTAQGLTGTPNITVGTIAATSLNVSGIGTIANIRATNINATGVTTSTGGFVGSLTGNVTGDLTGTATTATALQNSRTFEITGDIVASPISFDGTGNVSLAATIQPNSVALGSDTTGDYVANITGTSNQITVTSGTGEGSTPTLSIPNQLTAPQDVTVTRDLQVNRDLNVNGNITIGGSTATLFTTELKIFDPDIVLGFRTDASNNDVSNDNTANHGGVALASTEGTPLVSLFIAGIETNPATYKKIMWFKSGTFAGLGTDAWLSNYAVGIGSTQFPTGTRLATGAVQFTESDLAVVRNINASGVVTASSLNVSGVTTFNNNVILGGSSTDIVNYISRVGSGITPSQDNTHELGSSSLRWKKIFVGEIVGSLTGAASSISVTDDTTNENRFLVLSSTTNGISTVLTDSGIFYNPSINSLGVVGIITSQNLNVSGIATARQFSDYRALVGATSSATETFIVTVANKTANHRYFGTGSSQGYFIDGRESPFITLLPGKTYRFDQADGSNSSHPLRFYLEADKTTQYTTNVTTTGTAGNAGAYVEITITDLTPIVLHYQCSNHAGMGNAISNYSNFINTPYSITTLGGLSVTGVSTFAGITTVTGPTLFAKQLNVSGVTTSNGFSGNITGTAGTITTLNVSSTLNAVVGIVTNATGTNLNYSGISTLTTLSSTNGTITNLTGTAGTITNLAGTNLNFSGIVTASGGFNIGIQSGGLNVTTGVVTALNFIGAGNTFLYNSSTKTVNISISGGGGGSLSISTSVSSTAQDIGFVGGAATSIIGIASTGSRFVYLPSTGSVGIATSIPTSRLHVVGNVLVSGIITCTDINSTSDINLKTNIHPIENSLNIISNIRGVSFDWKESGKPSYGVIAQELEEVLPELVNGTDPKSVNYNGIIGILIEGMKSQQNQINELKAEIELLKNK